MPLCISNPPIPRKNSSHCTPPTPTHTPLLSQRITHSPSSVGAHPTPKTPNDKDLAHTPSQVLLKHWSHAPAHTVAQCTPRYGPSYGEVQITVPPPVEFFTTVQITNICQSQKYTYLLEPTAPPWSHHQHVVNPKPATDKVKLLDPIISIPSNTSLSFASSLNMDALITSFQKHMVKAPPYSSYPVVNLLVSYASDSFPALVGPPWYLTSIVSTIHKGPHTSILTSEATIFVRNEVQEMVQRSFSIVLYVDDALTYFGTHLRNSRLASMDQTNHKPRLVCNFSAVPDSTTPSINASTNSSTNPYTIQFGVFLPNLLYKIWEASLIDGPLYLSKWDIADAFHRCNICPVDI